MSTGYGNGLLQTAISLGSVFNAMAIGATVETAAFAIPTVTNATAAYCNYADLWLILSVATTTSAGSPNLQGVIIVSDDGTNFEPYFTINSQLFPLSNGFTYPLAASSAYSLIRVPNIIIPFIPSSSAVAKLILYNNLGVALPATVTATLYPAGGSIG